MKRIDEINYIKLYYPFLRYGEKYLTLNKYHKKYIYYYLLFVDSIILPPKDFLNHNVSANLKFLNDKSIKALLEHDLIITTATYNEIRDFKDLLECYVSPKNHLLKNVNFDIDVYYRDAKKQRKAYSSYLYKNLKHNKQIFSYIENVISKEPFHEDFLNFIYTLKLNNNELSYLKTYISYAYHYGGVVGNSAIIPPYKRNDPLNIYNPFYGLYYIEYFGRTVENILGKELYSNIDMFFILYRKLSDFRRKYYDFSHNYINMIDEITDLFSIKWKFYLYKHFIIFVVDNLINRIIYKILYHSGINSNTVADLINHLLNDKLKDYVNNLFIKYSSNIIRNTSFNKIIASYKFYNFIETIENAAKEIKE